jgi:polysaccharide biosynthesis protein PslH
VRILLLGSRLPYPLHDGEDLRVFHFAKYLSERHDLEFLGYGNGSGPNKATKFFKNIHSVEEQKKTVDNRGCLKRIVSAFSPSEMYSFDSHIEVRLQALLDHTTFDALWIPAWQMAPYAAKIRNLPIIFDVMDDGVLELARELRCSQSVREAAVNLKRLFVTFLFERKYFGRASLCSLVSERDAEVFRRVCPQAKQVVIPNGVDSDYFKPLGLDEKFPSIVFEGNMGFPPSVDAVLYFYREIFPLVVERVPEVKFFIVGKDPAPEIQALASHRVTVTGYVDDVRPYLDQSSMFVCPMRKGAGIKNKILQAWAMAKPVLATTTAVGGLCATDGENILIADEPTSFAEAVVRLLENPALRHSLGLSARETVLRHHTWQEQVQLLEGRMKDL